MASRLSSRRPSGRSLSVTGTKTRRTQRTANRNDVGSLQQLAATSRARPAFRADPRASLTSDEAPSAASPPADMHRILREGGPGDMSWAAEITSISSRRVAEDEHSALNPDSERHGETRDIQFFNP